MKRAARTRVGEGWEHGHTTPLTQGSWGRPAGSEDEELVYCRELCGVAQGARGGDATQECWLHPGGSPRRLITMLLGQQPEHSQHFVHCAWDAMVEDGGGDRSERGLAFRFNLLMSYSDPLWAGLGITLAAQWSRDLCLVGIG